MNIDKIIAQYIFMQVTLSISYSGIILYQIFLQVICEFDMIFNTSCVQLEMHYIISYIMYQTLNGPCNLILLTFNVVHKT